MRLYRANAIVKCEKVGLGLEKRESEIYMFSNYVDFNGTLVRCVDIYVSNVIRSAHILKRSNFNVE